ncbi:MAG TPA: 3-isopropylmalate dehydrogenase [Pyrinomonadaceae bacterium]|jgi:3-isopropylmalate dehydrogenase
MKITVLAGDGIGPEITREAVKVLQAVGKIYEIDFEFTHAAIGGEAIRKFDTPLPQETIDVCLACDAVLLGAVGAPEFDQIAPEKRPEQGLLKIRKALGGFANLRPAKIYKALAESSPLRPEILGDDTDFLIVRELLGGLYFGAPRGFEENEGDRKAYNTMHYTVSEIERVAHIAFQAAGKRKKRLASVDKANVLETSRLWRETVNKVAKNYPEIELEHFYVDATAMMLVTNPDHFDVILTENLFGDILSDEASVLTGSLGMLPSATIGGQVGIYEPIHGSAPGIAGQNIANPCGMIASAAMLLRYSSNYQEAANAIESAVEKVLEKGLRTKDIARGGDFVSTEEMGDAIVKALQENTLLSSSKAV